MTKDLIKAFLEAFAHGDAFGKATEYCSRTEIQNKIGSINELLPPERSLTHEDLRYGQVTDDTEQNIYLIKDYIKNNRIKAEDTALILLNWIKETDAMKYIGPSSLKALEAIRDGADSNTTGIYGTTCGGIMRSPAAALLSINKDQMVINIVECLKPTHNTSIAIESAMSYAFALTKASEDNATIEDIIKEAKDGAMIGEKLGNSFRTSGVAPSVSARLSFIEKILPKITTEEDLKYLLYDILGTTLASYDVACASFAIFMFTKGDTMNAIKIATELGGDTDTIAALAGGLCAMYSKKHNLLPSEIKLIEEANNIDFDALAELIFNYRTKLGENI